MITADKYFSERLRFGDHFIGIAAIAHGVAEIYNQVMGGSSSQTGVQRFEVAMNVAKNKDAHKGRIIAFLRRK
jgi:hypothetical protein